MSKVRPPNPYLKKQLHESYTEEAIKKCGDLIEDYMQCTRKYYKHAVSECMIERAPNEGKKAYFTLPEDVAKEHNEAIEHWKRTAKR